MKTKSLVLDRFIDLTPIGPTEEQGPIQIYKAFHIHRLAEVLLKVASRSPDEPLSTFIEAQNRLCLEAQATQRINHPNVVRVIDSSAGPTVKTFVALEYLEGEDLAQYLERVAPLSVAHVLEIAIPIADAINSAHRTGVIHGDIKPSNVMLVSGIPTLVDFGCSFCQIFAPFRPAGRPIGTYAYMCPTYRATAVLTERSDIFSFGVMLYEMLTGFNPFAISARSLVSETFTKCRGKRRKGKIPPLTELAPSVPREFAREIHRAMARNPAHRHGSMAELLSALESQERRLASIEPVATGIALGDQYATAGCGVPALARALDNLAEQNSPPTCGGQGTGFRQGFFAGTAHPKALEAPRSLPALMAHKPASSLEAVFTGTADASPLLKVKARDQAVTVPGVDTNGLALCAATFATLGCGTMARPRVIIHSSVQAADLGGPQTLPFVSCPDGISPSSRQTLAGGFSLEALRITLDPSAAIEAAMASGADTPPPDAVVRALETATPTPVRSLRSRPQPDKDPFATLPTGTMVRSPAPLRAHARSIAVTGPDTRPLGTLIVCSPRTTTPTQVAVAHKLEPETTVAEPAPIPQSAKLAVSAAVRVAPVRRIAAETPSSSPDHKLMLISGSSSKSSVPRLNAGPKDSRVYAGVPVRRATQIVPRRDRSTSAPFAEILAMNIGHSRRRRAAEVCGVLMAAGWIVAAVSSVRQLSLPVGSARETVQVVPQPVLAQPTIGPSAPSQPIAAAPVPAATPPAAPAAESMDPPVTTRQVESTKPQSTPRQTVLAPMMQGVPSGAAKSTCFQGQPSGNCVAPLRTRFDRDQPKRGLAVPSSVDPMIVNPWADENPTVKGGSQPTRASTPHRFLWRSIDSRQSRTPNHGL